MRIDCRIIKLFLAAFLASAGVVSQRANAMGNEVVYDDALQNGWADWSWGTQTIANSSPVHSGAYAIQKLVTGWEGLYLHRATSLSFLNYTNFSFWIHGGTNGGQHLVVQFLLNSSSVLSITIPPPAANTWQKRDILLAALPSNTFNEILFQAINQTNEGNVYLDDLVLEGSNALPPDTNTITVDALKNRHAISPLIYGVNFGSGPEINELNCPVNRWGGNASSRYNWYLNTANRGADWFFINMPYAGSAPGQEADSFIQQSFDGGAQVMITIPMQDWMPKARQKLWSYSVAKYGPQTSTEASYGVIGASADAGNGISTSNTTRITWNDPNDANYLTNSWFQQAWVRHLTNQWGLASNGGVRWYLMDNEPSLWHVTHTDVHPDAAKMAEVRDRFFDYAEKVKAVDPTAKVAGFEEWGWPGYFKSGYDQQYYSQTPDRDNNGGMDYIPWLLQQAHQREVATGRRLLDLLTVHIYPQSGEYSDSVDQATQLKRNRSTRQLWDTDYVDESWINDRIQLIPRLKAWVNTYYPGLPIGITEYSWSAGNADNSMNGATAQADLLGIFGREGLDLATRWAMPAAASRTFLAMKMFRNYDNVKSGFGDTSISASTADPDKLSAFAAVRSSDSVLTIMVINKQLTESIPATLLITNFTGRGPVQVWQLATNNPITRLADASFTGNTISNQLPPQSITLFIVPPIARPGLRPVGISGFNTYRFWLDGEIGQRYAICETTNLSVWTPVQTNQLINSASQLIDMPATAHAKFYRAMWVP